MIVNPLTSKSRSWAPSSVSNIYENSFKAITFRQTGAGLTETQEKKEGHGEIHTFAYKQYIYIQKNTCIYLICQSITATETVTAI